MENQDQMDKRNYLASLCRTVPFHLIEALMHEASEKGLWPLDFLGSVLFVDVVGFISLSEKMVDDAGGSGELTQWLDNFFGALLEQGIFPYSGYVVQFGGDSMTVVFKDEGFALRACVAAQTCCDIAISQFNKSGEREDAVQIRASIASGEVRLPVIGDLVRRVSVCAGRAAHRALQLQKQTEPNKVSLDQSTYTQAGQSIACRQQAEELWQLEQIIHPAQPCEMIDINDFLQHDVDNKIALLETFVSRPLANRLRLMPQGWRLTPEMREAVIVFVEVWGLDEVQESSRASLQTASDMGRSLLRCIYKYGGVISKVDIADRGHRILVGFGLHKPADNDAERALLASLEASTKIRRFAGERSRHIGVRIGIHQGPVYFGSIGSDYKHDITVIGDTVNIAARVTSAADNFSVLLTEQVKDRVAESFEFADQGLVKVKGKSQALHLYQALSSQKQAAHFLGQRKKQRLFIGQQAVQQQLDQAVDDAMAGRARVLALVGEQGTGKSALLARLIDTWVKRGGRGAIGRCTFASKAYPLAPVVSMLHNFLGIRPEDSDLERADRIRRGLLNHFQFDQGVPELVALLQPVQRQDGASETALDLSDNYVRERLLSAIVRFMEQRMDQEPLMYIVEDLHHADSLTLQMINYLSGIPRSKKFILAGTFRPSIAVDAVSQTFDQKIELGPLDEESSVQLICRTTAAQRVEPELAHFLLQRSQGNPLFILEILGFLQEHHLLQVLAGQLRSVDASVDQFDRVVPRSLSLLALARIEALGEAERRVVRTASTIGTRFNEQVLDASCDASLDPGAINAALSYLSESRIFQNESNAQQFRFHEDSVRAAAYGTIPHVDRSALHKRVADALEELSFSSESAYATSLAYHRERAGQLELAAKWYEQAIIANVRKGLDAEALRLARPWRKILSGLPDPDVTAQKRRHQCLLMLMSAAVHLGLWSKLYEFIKDFNVKQEPDLAQEQVVHLAFFRALSAMVQGRSSHAQKLLNNLLEQKLSQTLRLQVLESLLRMDFLAGRLHIAQGYLAAIDQIGELSWGLGMRLSLLRCQLEAVLELDVSVITVLKKIAGATRERSMFELSGQAELSLGLWSLYHQDLDGAEEALLQALRLLRMGDYAPVEARSLMALGQLKLWQDQDVQALQYLQQAEDLAVYCGDLRVSTEAAIHRKAGLLLKSKQGQQGAEVLEALQQRCLEAKWDDLLWLLAFYRLRAADPNPDYSRAALLDVKKQPWARYPLYLKFLDANKGE